MAVTSVSDATFQDEVIASDKLVLVDFWAEWCGPCKMLAPLLDEIDAEIEDIKIVKVDVDANPNVTVQYGVRAMPTLILFKNGEPVGTQQGMKPKSSLVSWIQSV